MFLRTLVWVIAVNFVSGCATMHAVDIGDRWSRPSKFESVALRGDRMTVRYAAVVRSSGPSSRVVDPEVMYTGEMDFNALVWSPLSTRPSVCKMPVRALSDAEAVPVQRQAAPTEQGVVIVPVTYAPSKDNYGLDPEHVRRAYSGVEFEEPVLTAYAVERSSQLTLVRVSEDGRTLEWTAVTAGLGTTYTEPWAYPVRGVAVPVAVMLDLVTLPIQVLVVVHQLSSW